MKTKAGDIVRVHFICRLPDGNLYETSFGDEPLQFTVGEGQVIPALEQAVVGMEPGELKRFTVQLNADHPDKDYRIVSGADKKI
jgi:FKBP-type peptidyl-prolyl cis-trans isomerase 2